MRQTHIVNGKPVIGAEVVEKHVNAATFLSACTDADLEETDHAEVLFVICVMLDLRENLEALTFVDPLVRIDLSDEAHLLSNREQSLF